MRRADAAANTKIVRSRGCPSRELRAVNAARKLQPACQIRAAAAGDRSPRSSRALRRGRLHGSPPILGDLFVAVPRVTLQPGVLALRARRARPAAPDRLSGSERECVRLFASSAARSGFSARGKLAWSLQSTPVIRLAGDGQGRNPGIAVRSRSRFSVSNLAGPTACRGSRPWRTTSSSVTP